jgi:protein-S-isoprenylcysteine O-methyltransferase Ste14
VTVSAQKLVDLGERVFVLIIYASLLFRLAPRFSSHPHIILLALSELLVVLFILIRRPGEIAQSPYALLIAFGGTAIPMLVRPDDTELVPDAVATALMMGGLCLTIWAKLSLNRSFGIVAANRGVKVGGPYRLVRHPMYLGYIVTQAGFLLVNFSARNLAVYAAAWTFQILRIGEEEAVLRRDPSYRHFTNRVGNRLIPGIY